MTVEWKVSTKASIATLGAQAWVGGAAVGTELVNTAEPTSDTARPSRSLAVTGLSRDDLLNGVLEVRGRATRGNSNTAVTASLDAVSVKVDYTTPNTVTITTDAVGNLVARGTSTYAYDQANRLRTATVAGTTETYAHDDGGVRYSRTVGANPAIRVRQRRRHEACRSRSTTAPASTSTASVSPTPCCAAPRSRSTTPTGLARSARSRAPRGPSTATYRTDEFGGLTSDRRARRRQPFRYMSGRPWNAYRPCVRAGSLCF